MSPQRGSIELPEYTDSAEANAARRRSGREQTFASTHPKQAKTSIHILPRRQNQGPTALRMLDKIFLSAQSAFLTCVNSRPVLPKLT
jgi:hypothetical protein